MEKTEEQYEREIEEIEEMFPNAKFTIAINIEELDVIFTKQPAIVVKKSYNCYCYTGCNKPSEYFYISGKNITTKFIINQLIEQGLELNCNHHFIEGFEKVKNSDCQFEIYAGS